ncbi:protease [Ovine adenovirus 7]|uniref:Protease n=1 Tax=Ovine adenovirus D serotype 7 (isolate OAV287) TaxID=114430 RepID=PRO_ADEO7|nr:protease [Ovine adenovirus 7]Q83906.1 RecName: Full=Protease; AltName: Full=Adenain; AltName: Full=Adenovirus protease; Short=AVP; AltName: Full=Adenovirus proteinase; AltName: Full=Endoprotease [Ovine adenovirus 7]AAA84980.1 protease [Ovine adenovirus 7]
MSGTSESELKNLISSLHLNNGFLGIFDCRFPGFLQKSKIQTAIINTGPREQGGIHWITLALEPISYKLFIFDPLGWKDTQLIKFYNFSLNSLIKRSALNNSDRCITVERNTQSVQCTCAGSCGLFCIFFLYCFHFYKQNVFKSWLFQKLNGSTPSLIPCEPHLLHENQTFLYDFLNAKSVYFRKNYRTFIENTKTGLIKTH